MGTFNATFEIGSPDQLRWETIEAMVDTDATFTWIPRDALERLGVVPRRRLEFEIAGGGVLECDLGEAPVRYHGDVVTTLVVFGDVGSLPLLGAYTLEGFSLAADPMNRRLVPVRAFAMATTAPAD